MRKIAVHHPVIIAWILLKDFSHYATLILAESENLLLLVIVTYATSKVGSSVACRVLREKIYIILKILISL